MIPLIVKFPTRSRPERFRYALELLVKHAVRPHDLHFLFTLDDDDPARDQLIRIIGDVCMDSISFSIPPGNSTGKINAVNRDLPEFNREWSTVIVASDDMHATPAWDAWVIDAMANFYPDGDGCLWFQDGFQKDIATISCMGRAYYDGPAEGNIYDPRFKSVFADDYFTHKAYRLGKMTKIDHVLFRHDHPAWNSALKPDLLYQKNEAPEVWAHDEKVYRELEKAGWP